MRVQVSNPMAGKRPKSQAMVVVGSVNVPGYTGRVNAAKYEAMKAILLQILPSRPPGLTQAEMFAAVRTEASTELFPGTTHMWWAKSVQLDLEKKRVVVRDAKSKPLRWTSTK